MTELARINEHSTEIANPEHQTESISSLSMLLLISGSVHPNLGPFNLNLSVAHLNTRSGLAQATLMRGSE